MRRCTICRISLGKENLTGLCSPHYAELARVSRVERDCAIVEAFKAGEAEEEIAARFEVTLGTVRRACIDLPSGQPSVRLSDIVTIASRLTGAPLSHIMGENRNRNICAVRCAIYTVARDYGYSFPQIGAHVGARDHSSVINSLRSTRRFQHAFECFEEFVEAVRYNAETLPPFVAESDWKPAKRFKFGRFIGPTRGQGADSRQMAAITNRRQLATTVEKVEIKRLQVVRRRNDFATDGDSEYRFSVQAMIRGSQALAAAIHRARAA